MHDDSSLRSRPGSRVIDSPPADFGDEQAMLLPPLGALRRRQPPGYHPASGGVRSGRLCAIPSQAQGWPARTAARMPHRSRTFDLRCARRRGPMEEARAPRRARHGHPVRRLEARMPPAGAGGAALGMPCRAPERKAKPKHGDHRGFCVASGPQASRCSLQSILDAILRSVTSFTGNRPRTVRGSIRTSCWRSGASHISRMI